MFSSNNSAKIVLKDIAKVLGLIVVFIVSFVLIAGSLQLLYGSFIQP